MPRCSHAAHLPVPTHCKVCSAVQVTGSAQFGYAFRTTQAICTNKSMRTLATHGRPNHIHTHSALREESDQHEHAALSSITLPAASTKSAALGASLTPRPVSRSLIPCVKGISLRLTSILPGCQWDTPLCANLQQRCAAAHSSTALPTTPHQTTPYSL